MNADIRAAANRALDRMKAPGNTVERMAVLSDAGMVIDDAAMLWGVLCDSAGLLRQMSPALLNATKVMMEDMYLAGYRSGKEARDGR